MDSFNLPMGISQGSSLKVVILNFVGGGGVMILEKWVV